MSEEKTLKHTFRHARKILLASLALLFLLYLASGIYALKPEQTGVLMRFGKIVADDIQPGIHYHLPWPFESVSRPNTREIRSLELTFRNDEAAEEDDYEGGQLLTGDENIVLLTLLVQYTIKSPADYLTGSEYPEYILSRLIQAESVRLFASMYIDDILTTGRNSIQIELKQKVQKSSDGIGLGIQLVSVQMQAVEPPPRVAHSFKDVASAREDMHKMLQKANGERNRRLPEARAQAERSIKESEAQASEMIEMARGDAEKFLSVWDEYRKARSVTAHRIYMETVENVLTRVKKHIVNPNAERKAGNGMR